MTIRNRFAFLTAVAALLFAGAPTVAADAPIARIPSVSDASTDPTVVALFADIRARGGKPLNLQLVTGNAPKIGKAMLGLAYSLRFDATTARPVRELAILRTAQMMNAPYELAQHMKLALACGITAAQIDGLENWQHGNLFDDRQRALLGYVEEVVRGGNVDDATFATLQRYFDTHEITELTITTSAYVSTALFTKSLRVAPEEDGRTSVQGSC
jgi:alkylhydroperoxidase family enzyme